MPAPLTAAKRLSIREAALRFAITQLGVTEHPPNSNSGPQVTAYLRSAGITTPAPWCLAFVHYSYLAGAKFSLPGGALVQAFDDWATKVGDIVQRPLRGDLVCYDWNGDHWDDHVGIVVKVLALRWRGKTFSGWVKTIEGNTAVGNDSNGGQVMYRYRWIASARFARVPGVVA